MDYSTLVLTEEEQSIFNKFCKSDSAILNKSDFQLLRTKGLVNGSLGEQSDWFDVPDSGECHLSQKGLEYKAFLQQKQKEKRTEQIRYWVPIIFADVLSIIAIIISILK